MLIGIRNLHTLGGDGQTAHHRRVPCPRRGRALPLDQCLACAESGGIERDAAGRVEYVACRHAGPAAQGLREDLRPAAERTTVAEVMTTDVFAVRPDVRLEEFAELLLARAISVAPVVDEDGRPVGLVSATNVLEWRFGPREGGDAAARVLRPEPAERADAGAVVEPWRRRDSVAEAMTCAALTLPENAALARAAAVMAVRGIRHVLVVAWDGTLSGVVSSGDIVRWIAARPGPLSA